MLDRKLLDAHFRLTRLINKQLKTSECMVNLSISQVRALFYLAEKQNAQISEIADFFQFSIPTATILIDKLVQMKLVSRKGDIVDRRKVRVNLTSNGRAFLEKADKERVFFFGKLLSKLTLRDKKVLLNILDNIASNHYED